MKIAIVCKNLSFITGGPHLLFHLARELKSLGQEVTIYAAEVPGDHFREISQGLEIIVVPPRFLRKNPVNFFGWVWGKIREEFDDIAWAKTIAAKMDSDVDVVNVHDLTYRVGYFYKKRNTSAKAVWQENIPLFLYVRRGKVLHDMAGSFYWFIKKLADDKYFKAIDTVSVLEKVTKTHREARGFRGRVVMIRAGVDFEKFYGPVKDFSQKAAQKKVRIFALGALNAARRFDNVVDAVRYLREWGYDARAQIVAKNIWGEDTCRDGLTALVKKNNLAPYVELNFEGLSQDELVKSLHQSDVFVQAVYAPPPTHQGWGLVNFEAMAAGLALVVVRSSAATEVLKDGETALFFDPLQPEQIAERVKFLVDHPDAYRRIAEAGQVYVRDNQSWKKYAEEMRGAFTK